MEGTFDELYAASEINKLIKDNEFDKNQISDGYHTFGELYDHRNALWMALLKVCFAGPDENDMWKSKKQSDGTEMEDWFLLGCGFDNGEQMSYHLPIKYWEKCSFAQELEIAPAFDGHTSADVLKRVLKILDF